MTETLNVDASDRGSKELSHASKDGRHFVFVLQKGDRQAPVVDGVVGMEYAGELIALNFSPNNQQRLVLFAHRQQAQVAGPWWTARRARSMTISRI